MSVEGGREGVGVGELVGEHERVLDGKAAALTHVRMRRVRGVTDEHHAAVVPPVERDGAERGDVRRRVPEASEEIRHRPAELGEAVRNGASAAFAPAKP
jgi:hypothetical protein